MNAECTFADALSGSTLSLFSRWQGGEGVRNICEKSHKGGGGVCS